MNLPKMIEIEIHAYCNRTCNWCPNMKIDRSDNKALSYQTYSSLIEDLSLINYEGTISYSRYNEPFSEIEYLSKCISLARKFLPRVKLVSNTNGDFISKVALDKAPLDELTIMDYDNLGLNACIKRLQNWGVMIDRIDYPYIHGVYKQTRILYYVDWLTNGLIVDRGGLVNQSTIQFKSEKTLRKRPCFEPYRFVGIDFNGNVMPCCNLRSDHACHQKYVLGNIYEESIFEILVSPAREKFLSKICTGTRLPDVCKTCQKDDGRYTREKEGIEYV